MVSRFGRYSWRAGANKLIAFETFRRIRTSLRDFEQKSRNFKSADPS